METEPQVSVIIPAYNACQFLKDTLDSVLGQSFQNLEIIVVNDGSTDETAGLLEKYRSKINRADHPKNKGLSAAINTGISLARGELIALLDADDLWNSNKVASQVKVFKNHPEVGVCFTDYSKFGAVDSTESGFDERNGALRTYPRKQIDDDSYVITSQSLLADFLAIQAFPMPSTVMVRRSALEFTMPLEEDLAYQDLQMYLRMAQRCTFAYIDRCLVQRRVHIASLGNSIGSHKFIEMHIKALERLDTWVELSSREKAAAAKLEAAYRQAAGYLAYDNYDLAQARRYFTDSLRRRFTARVCLYLLLSCFPKPLIRRIRGFKQRLQIEDR